MPDTPYVFARTPDQTKCHAKGIDVTSDVTKGDDRWFYVNDVGRWDEEAGEQKMHTEGEIAKILEGVYPIRVVNVRQLCVPEDYAVTAKVAKA